MQCKAEENFIWRNSDVVSCSKFMPTSSPWWKYLILLLTAWKVSVFGVILVHIFPHLDWIRRDTEYLSLMKVFDFITHWLKSVRIRSNSGPYFPSFGLDTERYGVSLRIQSEWGEMRTRISPNTGTFYAIIDILKNNITALK